MPLLHTRASLLGLFFILLLPGCARWRKRERAPLQAYVKEQDNVQLSVRPLDKKQSQRIFGKKVPGHQPLELIIENNNESYYILHPWYITLPLAIPKKVAKQMHTSTPLVVWGMMALGIFGVEWFAPFTPFLYASLPVGIWVSNNNKTISKNVTREAIARNAESIIVPPYGQIRRYIFISRHDFSPHFTVTLLNGADNKPNRFAVSLAA